MTRGLFILIILLLAACDEHVTEVYEYYIVDTDSGTDPDCFESAEICTYVFDPYCVPNDGKPFLHTEKGCVCVESVQYRYYEDQVCLEGCVENSNGVDYCLEDAP